MNRYGFVPSGNQAPDRPKMQMPKRRLQEADDYFYDEDDSSAAKNPKLNEHEIDPLDAFMTSIDSTAEKQIKQAKISEKLELRDSAKNLTKKSSVSASKREQATRKSKGIRDDLENEDEEEQYYKWVEENPDLACPEYDEDGNLIRKIPDHKVAGSKLSEQAKQHLENEDEDEIITFDDDGNVHVQTKKQDIKALPVVYHSQIDYKPFRKNFYHEHSSIKELSEIDAYELRQKLEIKVTSTEKIQKPICSFAHLNLDLELMKIIQAQRFESPTPIQSQALPSILSGRDCIGIAKTGSGKTVAFSWPALIHAADQRRRPKSGPVALIISPTRELCIQTFEDMKKYAAPFNIRPLPLYGGGNMWEQAKHCRIKGSFSQPRICKEPVRLI